MFPTVRRRPRRWLSALRTPRVGPLTDADADLFKKEFEEAQKTNGSGADAPKDAASTDKAEKDDGKKPAADAGETKAEAAETKA